MNGLGMGLGLTFIGVIVEEISGLHCLWARLLVPKDQVDPVMEAAGHILTFLQDTENSRIVITFSVAKRHGWREASSGIEHAIRS